MNIDLNCDLGEGCGHDAELMSLITSANVACGVHAGDAGTIVRTLRLAKAHRVQVGAHPGYFDRDGFGRREQERSETGVFHDCLYQLAAMAALAQEVGIGIRYVKPHGAMYHQACRDSAYARGVVRAADKFRLAVMGLPGSALEKTAQAAGLPFVAEGFADRRYLPDGSLVPRGQPGAMISDPTEAARQAEWLIRNKGVGTICVHGDNPHAVAFVKELRRALTEQGHTIRAFAIPPSDKSS